MSHISSGEVEQALAEEAVERLQRLRGPINLEARPEEDDFGQWVAAHEREARAIVCNWPGFEAAPFCGRGHHPGGLKK